MDPVEQVRHAANLVEIASQYTNLLRRGSKYVGLCPFHTEKTPSFTVDEDKQLYHCFGCGAGGDVFTFVMEKESLTFPEALRLLAERYKIVLPETSRRLSGEPKLEEQVYRINEEALTFFRRNLTRNGEGKKALEYLSRRGVTEDTIRELRIGYAEQAWDGLLNYFQRKKVSPSLLEKAGLVLRRRQGDGFYDRFRGRVIFPIFSLSGKVLAFGGRTLLDENPKYLNSPDTPVYTKGKVLYGLNFTKGNVREKGEMILVEGYTDFLALYQAGIGNAAASLGTSLTEEQAHRALQFAYQFINRLAPRVVVCYDSDQAGRKAAARAVILGFEQTLQVDVALLPQGQDPDSFIRKFGAEAFKAEIAKSRPGLRFLLDSRLPKGRPSSPEEKARAAREILQSISKIPDRIALSEYLKNIGEYLDIDEKTLRGMISGKSRKPGPAARTVRFLAAEERLLQIVFADSDIASTVFKEMEPDDFSGLKSEPLFRALSELFRNRKTPELNDIRRALDPAVFSALIAALQADSSPGNLAEARECLSSLRMYSLTWRLKHLKANVQDLKKRGEQDKIPPLLTQIMDLNKHLYELSQRPY